MDYPGLSFRTLCTILSHCINICSGKCIFCQLWSGVSDYNLLLRLFESNPRHLNHKNRRSITYQIIGFTSLEHVCLFGSRLRRKYPRTSEYMDRTLKLRECSSLRSNASVNTVKCFQGIPKEFRGNMTVLIPMHLILNYCIHIVVK